MATIALSSRYGSKLAYDAGIWGESYRLFAAKFISWLVFWLVPKVVFSIGCVVNGDKVIHGYQKILKIEIYEGKTPLGSKYVDIVYLHLLFVNFFFFYG